MPAQSDLPQEKASAFPPSSAPEIAEHTADGIHPTELGAHAEGSVGGSPSASSGHTSTERDKTVRRAKTLSILLPLLLILALGAAAYLLASLHSSLDALFLALLLGIVVRILTDRIRPGRETSAVTVGARLGVRLFIPVGIILYGVNLDFSRLASLPVRAIVLTLLCMTLFYILIYWLNAIWRLPARLSELIASGSAVCGASAIAVLSPSVEAEPEDTSASLLIITAAGLLGVMSYPLLKEFLSLSDQIYAALAGATLHQTGLVRIALTPLPEEMASLGIAIKTLRIVMLAPVAIITSLVHSTRDRRFSLSALRDKSIRVWFLLPFIGIGLLISLVPESRPYLTLLKPWATLAFSVGLASIGLTVDIESVLSVGGKPLFIGILGWLGVILFFVIVSPFLL